MNIYSWDNHWIKWGFSISSHFQGSPSPSQFGPRPTKKEIQTVTIIGIFVGFPNPRTLIFGCKNCSNIPSMISGHEPVWSILKDPIIRQIRKNGWITLIKDWDSVPREMTTVAIALNCPMITCVRSFSLGKLNASQSRPQGTSSLPRSRLGNCKKWNLGSMLIHTDIGFYWFLCFFSFPLVITVLIVFYRFLRFLVAYYWFLFVVTSSWWLGLAIIGYYWFSLFVRTTTGYDLFEWSVSISVHHCIILD